MIGQLIESLCIANNKLYDVCNKKADAVRNPGNYTKKDLLEILSQDISLCRRRAQLKSEIDNVFSRSIMEGEADTINEVKRYGSDSG